MVFKVRFSERASLELTDILKYIEKEWSLKIAEDFSDLLNKKISYLESNPLLYPSFKSKTSIRRCVVSQQVSMFYTIVNDEVRILSLFDTRQNPKKINL